MHLINEQLSANLQPAKNGHKWFSFPCFFTLILMLSLFAIVLPQTHSFSSWEIILRWLRVGVSSSRFVTSFRKVQLYWLTWSISAVVCVRYSHVNWSMCVWFARVQTCYVPCSNDSRLMRRIDKRLLPMLSYLTFIRQRQKPFKSRSVYIAKSMSTSFHCFYGLSPRFSSL